MAPIYLQQCCDELLLTAGMLVSIYLGISSFSDVRVRVVTNCVNYRDTYGYNILDVYSENQMMVHHRYNHNE